MQTYVVVLGAIIGGAIITVLTYFYDVTPAGLVGARWYGFPFMWIRRLVVAPQYDPWRVDYLGFVGDFVIWIVLCSVVLFGVLHLSARA